MDIPISKHFLGCISRIEEADHSSSHFNFNLELELSTTEYHKLMQAVKVVNSYIKDSQMFSIVSWNYKDFTRTINNYLHAFDQKNEKFITEFPIDVNLNRVFLNLLSSVRSYFDFMDRKIKREHGEESDIYSYYTNYRHAEFDTKVSFRFLEKLRNYSQHKGFPIGSFVISKGSADGTPKMQSIGINMFFLRDELLLGFDWGKIKPDIEAMATEIPVLPHVASYLNSINVIHINTMYRILATLHVSANYVIEACAKISCLEGVPVIFEVESEMKDFNKINHIGIPVNFCNEIINRSEAFSS